jgi:predicted O-methyltransferase YrrM
MNLIFEYFKYRIKAKGRHGIHSPFVYDFVNKCLTTKMDKKFISIQKKLFKNLKTNHTTININDFGAGSKKLSNERSISSIFSNSSSKGRYGKLLYSIANYYHPKNILEFGTSLGIGSIHLSAGNKLANIITVEGCQNTFLIAKKNFEITNSTNVNPLLSTFKGFLDNYSGDKFDIIFIDGHHDGLALIDYLTKLKPLTHNDSLFILDDIRWSDSMFKAWNLIVNDPYYHVSIDLFRLGIILPRHQQTKEHFTIKI